MDEEVSVIFDGELSDWVAALPAYQQQIVAEMLETRTPVEVALSWLNSTGPTNTEPYGAIRTASNAFYDSLLSQLHSLLCGTARSAGERAQLIQNAKAGRAAVVTAVSGAIAPHLGVSAILIAPAVALTFATMSQAGKASACAALDALIEERKSKYQPPTSH